ncbi:endonuclease VIII [Bacillus sp. FJAT-42376]|uniref:endonuclease VIII n=1 Tax=Bacillus sp. FJAT-42376 TaxID=2014076 RepID=UPI000F4ECD07|nr:endonuclease VIII [Bacillus sp. FJAT-42376]AZB42734.1 endonuclease VIII [Bacillus sp. FJAT-42376]
MPEGPEIRRAADQIEAAVMNAPILEVFFGLEPLQEYESLFQGAQLKKIETKGKAMLIRFDNGYTVYSHNQLYGKWFIRSSYTYPKTNRQLRMAIHTEKKSALLYSASDILVMTDKEADKHPFILKAGPDLLNDEVTADELVKRFVSTSFCKRKWVSLLLDQSFIAGIGNYLRSEILFEARIHPDLRPADCSLEQLKQAAESALRLTWRSYETGGITADPELAARLKKEGVKRSSYRHWVFNREGEHCRICGAHIKKTMAASRRIYYCPDCQRKTHP